MYCLTAEPIARFAWASTPDAFDSLSPPQQCFVQSSRRPPLHTRTQQGKLLFFDTVRCEVVHERRLRQKATSLTVNADESMLTLGYIDGTREQLPVVLALQPQLDHEESS